MGISVRQVELLLQRLKEAGYIRAQTWKDPDGQVAEGKPYEYYYVDQVAAAGQWPFTRMFARRCSWCQAA